MSILILSLDISSDRIGEKLYQELNQSKQPRVASLCSSKHFFDNETMEFEKIFSHSLKLDGLSHNDLLGFLVLIDVATTSRLHINDLPTIRSLFIHLNEKHSFQAVLTFVFHGHFSNQLYTTSLTYFDLNLILLNIYSFTDGIIFYSVDTINDPNMYHQTISQRIGNIFQPVSSLRENSFRITRTVSIEFLQLVQHLLNDPRRRILFLIDENIPKIIQRVFHSAILIQRGQPSASSEKFNNKHLDIWYSLERISQTVLIINSDEMTKEFLDRFIIEPYRKKVTEHHAFIYWLRKKFDRISNIEELLLKGVELCQQLILSSVDVSASTNITQ